MSRRRYISTEMGKDKRLCSLSDFAALLYTWMLPHAEDCGSIKYDDPDELAWTVMPGRKWTTQKIENAVSEMIDAQLVILSEGRLYYPCESFYKYQTYIPPAKRRDYNPDAEERRETPKNTASPSPSPSPSPSYMGEFDEFWQAYPRKIKKDKAREAWAKAVSKVSADTIVSAIQKLAPVLVAEASEPQFIPHASTWLNQERWTDDPFAGRSARITSDDELDVPDFLK